MRVGGQHPVVHPPLLPLPQPGGPSSSTPWGGLVPIRNGQCNVSTLQQYEVCGWAGRQAGGQHPVVHPPLLTLPQPGGPSSSTPWGGLVPIRLNRSGALRYSTS